MRRLSQKAYPDAPPSVHESLSMDCFIDALSDSDLCWKVIQSSPRNLNEAISTAAKMEAFQAAERQRNQWRKGHKDVHVRYTGSTDSEDSKISQLQQQIESLTKQMRTWRQPHRPQQYRPAEGRPKPQCFRCGSTQHFIRQCPEPPKEEEHRRTEMKSKSTLNSQRLTL